MGLIDSTDITDRGRLPRPYAGTEHERRDRIMREFTKDQWTDYTGTDKNFDVYVEAQKIINRGKWFFIGLFTTYAITQTALLYLIIHA